MSFFGELSLIVFFLKVKRRNKNWNIFQMCLDMEVRNGHCYGQTIWIWVNLMRNVWGCFKIYYDVDFCFQNLQTGAQSVIIIETVKETFVGFLDLFSLEKYLTCKSLFALNSVALMFKRSNWDIKDIQFFFLMGFISSSALSTGLSAHSVFTALKSRDFSCRMHFASYNVWWRH